MKPGILELVCKRLHHRSLTCALLTLVCTFFALALMVELGDSPRGRAGFSVQEEVIAGLCFAVALVTFWRLLSDNRSGYAAMRLSVATLIWALACVPIAFLTCTVVGDLLKRIP